MKQEDIELIEQELDISLPESYKREALKGIMVNSSTPKMFYDAPKDIIRTNRRLRQKGLFGEKWRCNLFVMGYYRGMYFFIDSEAEDGEVYLADRTKGWHYTAERVKSGDVTCQKNIRDFISGYCGTVLMLDEDARNPKPPLTEEQKANLSNNCYTFLGNLRNNAYGRETPFEEIWQEMISNPNMERIDKDSDKDKN